MTKNERESWDSLTNIKRSSSNEILADAIASGKSPWFSGHFPGEPILPGIALLGMVFEAIKQACDKNLIISGVKRVKFKKIIKPGDKIQIIAREKNDDNSLYTFQVMVDSQIACNGIMTVEPVSKRPLLSDIGVRLKF
jgi:3-hydroxymyristoyl/3-hydroxydecanoyl-(acyl carrier protein) dehydratase